MHSASQAYACSAVIVRCLIVWLLCGAAPAEPAKAVQTAAPAQAEGPKEEGGSPLAPVLATVGGIIVAAIAGFSSNASSAAAYEAEMKGKAGAGKHVDSPWQPAQHLSTMHCGCMKPSKGLPPFC